MRRPPEDIEDAIVQAAIELADAGGFEHVRQREVAARAGVALNTLYKRFASKEELLAAAMAWRAEELERHVEHHPPAGKTPEERLVALFSALNRGLVARPGFARATIRATASGDPAVAGRIIGFRARIGGMIIAALRGRGRLGYADLVTAPPTPREEELALLLMQVWYASQVAWSAGFHGLDGLDADMTRAVRVALRGLEEPSGRGRARRAATARRRTGR